MAKLNDEDIRDCRNEPAPRELPERELDTVAGGRKAGGEQQEYLIVKLKEVFVDKV